MKRIVISLNEEEIKIIRDGLDWLILQDSRYKHLILKEKLKKLIAKLNCKCNN